MSYAFEARFSRVPLSFTETLDRIDESFSVAGLEFTGEITRLHHRRGMPIVKTASAVHLSTVLNVKAAAKAGRWWGVSMLCNSIPLREALGRNTATEVDLAVFPHDDGHLVTYTEPKGAFWARVRNPALEHQLGAMMSVIAASLDATVGIYAEEREHEDLVIPTLESVLADLKHGSSREHAPQRVAIIAERVLSLEQARAHAGRFANRVRRTTRGYVVIPMLTDRV